MVTQVLEMLRTVPQQPEQRHLQLVVQHKVAVELLQHLSKEWFERTPEHHTLWWLVQSRVKVSEKVVKKRWEYPHVWQNTLTMMDLQMLQEVEKKVEVLSELRLFETQPLQPDTRLFDMWDTMKQELWERTVEEVWEIPVTTEYKPGQELSEHFAWTTSWLWKVEPVAHLYQIHVHTQMHSSFVFEWEVQLEEQCKSV